MSEREYEGHRARNGSPHEDYDDGRYRGNEGVYDGSHYGARAPHMGRESGQGGGFDQGYRDEGHPSRGGGYTRSGHPAQTEPANHRGHGPRGYHRSAERIKEDINDRLSDDPELDATGIRVSVDGSEVTLTGDVSSRWDKRHAEDCVEAVSGVTNVQNNLRVQEPARHSE